MFEEPPAGSLKERQASTDFGPPRLSKLRSHRAASPPQKAVARGVHFETKKNVFLAWLDAISGWRELLQFWAMSTFSRRHVLESASSFEFPQTQQSDLHYEALATHFGLAAIFLRDY